MSCRDCTKTAEQLASLSLSSIVLNCYNCILRARNYKAGVYKGQGFSNNEAGITRREQEE